MIAATSTNARKLAAFFSYRVATRRYCFTFDRNRSHTFRSAYRCGSASRCSARFFCVGMTARAPRDSISPTSASLSYPSSAITTPGRWSASGPPAWPMSDSRAAVGSNSTGWPRPSKPPWTSVPNPPRLLPGA